MLKINKLADYGLVVMSCLAHHAEMPLNAREVAHYTHLSLPTVSKLLKLLTNAGLLFSSRGVRGGYRLAHAAEKISLKHMLNALERDLNMTECSQGLGHCSVEHFCGIRHNWKAINRVIQGTLMHITLADMLKPATKFKTQVLEKLGEPISHE